MFKNNPDDITKSDYAFLRAIKIEIDKIIVNDEDYDEDKIFNNISNSAIKNCNKIINNLNELENLIKEKINELNNFEIEHNMRFENLIKQEIGKLENLNFFTFPLLKDRYKKYLTDRLTDSEKNAYIISIFAENYLNGKYYTAQKVEIKSKLKELIKYNILMTKLKKIHELIKGNFDKKINDINEASFINDVKDYINL